MSEQWYTAYAERNKTLLELGYPSYKAYLASTLWNSIRQRVIDRDRRSCWVCGFAARTVHHRLYSREVLAGQCLDYLVALCRDCHNEIEYAEKQKLSLHDANNRLEALKVEVAERRRISLTKPESVVKVPREQPSVQSTRRPSKRQQRHIKRNQQQREYLEARRKMLEHKASIVPAKPIMACTERRDDLPPHKPNPWGRKAASTIKKKKAR